jgi:hypothetical protein
VTTGRSRTVIIAVALVLAHAALGGAQEFEPRTYAVAPVDLNFIAVGYGFVTGAVFMDPAPPAATPAPEPMPTQSPWPIRSPGVISEI